MIVHKRNGKTVLHASHRSPSQNHRPHLCCGALPHVPDNVSSPTFRRPYHGQLPQSHRGPAFEYAWLPLQIAHPRQGFPWRCRGAKRRIAEHHGDAAAYDPADAACDLPAIAVQSVKDPNCAVAWDAKPLAEGPRTRMARATTVRN